VSQARDKTVTADDASAAMMPQSQLMNDVAAA
jgi:hypothetical protein